MNESGLVRILEECGAIMNGHFLLTSGRHSEKFLQCSRLMERPGQASAVCRLLAEPFRGKKVEAVVGPALGGIIPAYEAARHLGARALFAEPEAGKMVFRRGFTLAPGEKVLVVEDVVTTGGSVQKVINLLLERGARIEGVAAIVDRSGGNFNPGVLFSPLVNLDFGSHLPDECPLCRAGIPLVSPKGRPAG